MFRRLASFFAAICLICGALPSIAERASGSSLAGQLLVASTSMGDPRFERTVVLMLRHDSNGAFGLVINRLAGVHPLASLLKLLGDADASLGGEVRVFAGGPVQPELLFIVHGTDYDRPETIHVNDRFAVTSSREVLRDIGSGRGPEKSLVVFGYAGWSPGQLEGELGLRAWAIAPADSELVFAADREKLWERAFAQRVQDL